MHASDSTGPAPVPAPVRVGVLGCAEIARRRMLPAFADGADTRLVAVASREERRAEATAEQFGCAAVHGYDALLDREDVDAVYVPLPPALHDLWVESALLRGKHVLAEKPLTTDLSRTTGLLALARDKGLALVENVLFVHHGQHEAVRRLVADGAIGEPRSFRAEFSVPARAADDIRYRADLGGGALWDVGVYPVRAAVHLLGADLGVVGALRVAEQGRGVETSGAVLVRDPAGRPGQLSYGLGHAYRATYELCGTDGRITVERAFTPPAGQRPSVRLERGTAAEDVLLPAEDQVVSAVRAFAAAVRAGGRPWSGESVAQARVLDVVSRTAVAHRET